MKLTELEKFMLKEINEDYHKIGIENTEFYNTFGNDAKFNKELRGAFASLEKKGIVKHTNDPGCFNPIYPTRQFIDAMEEMGEQVDDTVIRWVRNEEATIKYGKEYNEWVERENAYNYTDENGLRYWKYPFKKWLKENHNIEL